MRSLSVRLLLSLFVLVLAIPVFAHDVTLSGTTTFAALDGSANDHDGSANGVFTVSDGNLVINGTVNCNDDSGGDNACSMAFAVSGNLTMGSGSALYAENRSGAGVGGAITLTVGGNLAMNGTAIVSTSSRSSSGSNGGNITANVGGAVTLASSSVIDAGSSNAKGGNVTIAAGNVVTANGAILSGPSRTILSTRYTGAALDGGTSNQQGGAITISSSSFAEPAILIGSTANIVAQGETTGAGPVTIDGCGIQVYGLVAALSRKDAPAKIAIRSGKDILVDGRDLGTTATARLGRVRADAPSGTAINKGVDIFAAETIDLLGASPSASTQYSVTSIPGQHDSKSYGGLIRVISLEDAVNATGLVIDDGHTASGDTGGTVEISAKGNANLAGAYIRAIGDFNTNNANRGGGSISVRSYSGDVIWTNGLGEVRPVGSTSGLTSADQGKIVINACGSITTTGTSFPVMGTATSVFPETHTGVCSPAAPSLPAGTPALVTCNTPPVANDTTASTLEDQSVTITLTGSDADGDSLTFSIVSGPSNGTLTSLMSTGPTSATVVYTPNLNYNGSDSFTFRVDDGNGGTDDAIATVTITAVNDAPSFQIGPTATSLEDAGAQTYANWVTAISAGPADEAGQTVTFTVTNDNPSLFSVQPAVASNGTLTYTAAANAYGTANVTVVAHDNGGTANGGVDTSASQSSSIAITGVNDAPSFTSGGNVSVLEDSGAYSAAWASAISAGPNESSQTVSFTASNDNNALFSSQPAISASGVLTFTPAANAFGSANVTVSLSDDGGTANGGNDTSAAVTFTITVGAVNDAPSFTGGGNVTVLEDSGAYSAAWATAISAGPANESGQALTFTVTANSNSALFAAQPAVDASGNLTFTPAANAFGSATITLQLSDDGGTANGGVDTSASYSFTITVDGVNDAPSFTGGGNVTVNEDSGAYSAPWASAISAGPNESGQTVAFNTSNDNGGLFSSQPAISPAGVLTFTPAPNAFGTATVSAYAQDNGGTANGGVDTSASVVFTITVTPVNDGPTAGNDSFETFGNTEIRVDLGSVSTPYVSATTGSGTGVLDNDADLGEGDPISVTGIVGCADTTAPYDCTVSGAHVVMNANGAFSYTPAPGATSGSFQYVVTDTPSFGSPASATGTVNFTITGMIWYVNGSYALPGNGTSNTPYANFGSLNGGPDVDNPGDTIFVHDSVVNGNITMEANQKLLGEGVGLSAVDSNSVTHVLVAAGNKPRVLGGAADTVTVTGVTGVEIAGLELNSTGGNGIEVRSNALGSATAADIHDNFVNGAAAQGIFVNANAAAGTTATVSNTNISSTGPGFEAASTAGTVNVSLSNGTITSTAGHGVHITGAGGGTMIVNGLSNLTISATSANDGVNVTNASFNNVNTGTLSIGSAGARVKNGVVIANGSGSLAFGTLNAYTTGGTGLGVASSASLTLSGSGGTINSVNGAGVSIANAAIGASDLTFTSVSSTNATNGIVLNTTGSLGGLHVTGTGSAGSGGTLSGHSGDAVLLTSSSDLALAYMSISGNLGSGIKGTTVNGFAVDNCSISNNGNDITTDESGINLTNLSGNASINNSTISNNYEFEVQVANNTGTLTNLQMTNDTVSSNGASGVHGNLVNFLGTGTATMTLNVSGGSYTGAAPATATGIHADHSGTGGVVTANVSGATFTNNNVAVNASAALGGSIVFDVNGNTATGTRSHGINVFLASSHTGTASGKIRNNVIGTVGVAGSGSAVGSPVRVQNEALSTTAVLIDNNSISEATSFPAVTVNAGISSSPLTGTLAATVTNNVIRNIGSRAIVVQQNVGKGTVCADVANNNMSGIAGQAGDGSKIRIRQLSGGTFNVRQKAASAAVDPAELDDVNSVGANVTTAAQVSASGTFNYNAGTCAQP